MVLLFPALSYFYLQFFPFMGDQWNSVPEKILFREEKVLHAYLTGAAIESFGMDRCSRRVRRRQHCQQWDNTDGVECSGLL